MLIAIVDDDSSMQSLLQATLEHAGYQVRLFPDAQSFLSAGSCPDLGMLVVDWQLPDMQGPELVRLARQHYGPQLPILFATQRQHEQDVVQALQAGADDFMSKPLQLPVFMARVQALARRAYPADVAHPSQFGPYRFDPDGRHVDFGAQRVALKGREYAIAQHLFRHEGQLVTRQQLHQLFWPATPHMETRSLDTHISQLRSKLQLGQVQGPGQAPQSPSRFVLQVVYGTGYRLERQ